MIITLGRSKINGKTAAVIESKDGVVYLNTYKQKSGFSSFNKLVESIELDEQRVREISEYYNRLKN
jgi:NADPH-dependent 7-cyano-7-deazaguanine reductase QueF-like protein